MAITRTSTLCGVSDPTRCTSWFCSTRSSLACVESGISPISSRNIVPPWACSTRPGLSFTGAVNDKPGLVEHAHGGTLFLDEIGDMPLSTQAKLLRVLQNQEVQRVGSLTPHKVDVRVIAVTNRDLRAAITEKRFREDLYYRLSMVEIRVPGLRERREGLPLLERHFVARFAEQYGKKIRGLTPRAQIRLSLHGWPGNVRELENVIGHACM